MHILRVLYICYIFYAHFTYFICINYFTITYFIHTLLSSNEKKISSYNVQNNSFIRKLIQKNLFHKISKKSSMFINLYITKISVYVHTWNSFTWTYLHTFLQIIKLIVFHCKFNFLRNSKYILSALCICTYICTSI